MGSTTYCLFGKDKELRELLRSERHSIQKLAIEKGYGDSLTGTLRRETPAQGSVIDLSPSQIASTEDQK
jgi:hypothetical protein